MKFLVVGLGSMGKRRIRNLLYLKEKDVIGFDVKQERCGEASQKYEIETFKDISIALKQNPDAMIISTPPDLHMKYAKIAIEHNIHFFTEASVVQDEMDEVIKELEKTDLVGIPSCTMKYHPIVQKINDILKLEKLGRVLYFSYHSGQYLPDWHPWEDYRKFYVSKKETGACREIVPFEIVWLMHTFGKIVDVMGEKAKITSLETDIDDIYSILMNFTNNVKGMLIVDVISRVPIRNIKIFTENGVIIADWYEKLIKYFSKSDGWEQIGIDDGVVEKGYIHGDKMYIQEIDNFIQFIKKEKNPTYTFRDDLQVLKILQAIEESSDDGIKKQIHY